MRWFSQLLAPVSAGLPAPADLAHVEDCAQPNVPRRSGQRDASSVVREGAVWADSGSACIPTIQTITLYKQIVEAKQNQVDTLNHSPIIIKATEILNSRLLTSGHRRDVRQLEGEEK